MSQLDWQTDQAAAWEALSGQQPAVKQLPWRWYLLLLVGLLALMAGAYWFVTGRGSHIESSAVADVLGTHRLVERARISQDPELLGLVLDDRDPDWAATQRSLLRESRYYGRPSFGLIQLAATVPAPGTSPTVTVGADLAWADVLTEVPYRADTGQRLSLLQTTFYRRQGEHWLLSPPGHDFWGRRANFLGQRILVSYRSRDAALARRLGADLDALLGEVCRTRPALACPDNLYVHLTLETGAATVRPAGLWRLLASDLQLRLPTPTLVGLPRDEHGYQALWRGYARQLLIAVIARQTGYRCCRHGPYYRALLDAQLAGLGLAPEPLAGGAPLPAESGLSLSAAGRYWGLERVSLPQSEIWPAYALVEFLVDVLQVNPVEAQQLMATGGGLSYWEWLRHLAGPAYASRHDLERRWQHFIQANFADVAAHPAHFGEPPGALEQDLYLLCQEAEGSLALYHYDLALERLRLVRPLSAEAAFMLALPDDQGLVLAERSRLAGPPATVARQQATDTLVWTPAREWLLSRSVADILPVAWLDGPEGSAELVVFDRGRREYGLLDPAACLAEKACAWDGLGGAPILGPDGEQLLVIPGGTVGYEGRFRRPIVLGDLTGAIVGQGQAPFWITAETVGYLADEGQALRAVDIGRTAPRQLLTAAELIEPALSTSHPGPRARRALQPARFEYAALHPEKPGSLLLAASLAGGKLFLFDFRPASSELRLRAATDVVLDANTFYNYGFSPDKHWMVIGGYDLTSRTASLHLHHMRSGETRTIQFNAPFDLPFHWYVDWSADGRWLSVPDNGFIRLLAPAFDHQRLIILDEVVCSAAVWTDQ